MDFSAELKLQNYWKKPCVVYKTLVTKSQTGNIYIAVIPSDKELDLKKLAKVAGEKKVDMIPQSDIAKTTGYVKGGCSPIGMKKISHICS